MDEKLTVKDFSLGDVVRINDMDAIAGAEGLENEKEYEVVCVHADTPEKYAFIAVADSDGDDVNILESEFGAITLVKEALQ